jgi:NADH-quinone oxidoreductase subunit L
MWLPLAILATITVVVGVAGFFGLNNAFAQFLNGGTAVTYDAGVPLDTLTLIGVGVALLGILFSWATYGLGAIPATLLTSNPIGRAIYRLLYRRYYLDELYMLLIRWIIFGLSHGCELFDRYVIDGIVNGSAHAVLGIGRLTRRSETGELQNYGAALFGGAMIILIVFFIAVGAIGR